MYMILSLHELISRCHLVNFDLLPPSTFKIHNMTQFCVFVFFLIKKHHDSMILYILLFILKYKCVVAFHFYFFFFNVLPEGGGAWRDVPYMYFKVVINTIIHFSFSATRVISKCILILPNKTDNSVHKAIIGKFKNICSNYQVYVIFIKYFSTSGQRNFLLFFPRDMELISGAG